MPETGDNIAAEFGIDREAADRFAAASQARYAAAKADGFYADEILPIEVPTGRRTPPILVADSSKAREELGWRPRHEDLATIVESAWRWRLANPDGYRGRGAE